MSRYLKVRAQSEAINVESIQMLQHIRAGSCDDFEDWEVIESRSEDARLSDNDTRSLS